jgi:hypothetical protein
MVCSRDDVYKSGNAENRKVIVFPLSKPNWTHTYKGRAPHGLNNFLINTAKSALFCQLSTVGTGCLRGHGLTLINFIKRLTQTDYASLIL